MTPHERALRSNNPYFTSYHPYIKTDEEAKTIGAAIRYNTHVQKLFLSDDRPATTSTATDASSWEGWAHFISNSPSLATLGLVSGTDVAFEWLLLQAVAENTGSNVRDLILRRHRAPIGDARWYVDGHMLAKIIRTTKTLSMLHLATPIHHHDVDDITSSLAMNSTIKTLRLEVLEMGGAASSLVRSLYRSPSLTALELFDADVDVEVVQALCKCLSEPESMRIWKLKNLTVYGYYPDTCSSLIDDLLIELRNTNPGKTDNTIKSLTLENFKINAESGSALRELLRSSTCCINELLFGYCSFAEVNSSEQTTLELILEGMEENGSVTSLGIRPSHDNPICEDELLALQQTIQASTCIEVLSLSGFKRASAFIADGLAASTHPTLTTLNLSDGRFSGDVEGVRRLLDAMEGCNHTFSITFGRSEARALATVCKRHRFCSKISSLDLRCCSLVAEKVQWILNGLKLVAMANQLHLKELNLEGNRFDDTCIHDLVALLHGDCQNMLEKLTLDLDASLAVDIIRSLVDNSVLTELSLCIANPTEATGAAVWNCLARTLPTVKGLKKLILLPDDAPSGHLSGLEKTSNEVMAAFEENSSLTTVKLIVDNILSSPVDSVVQVGRSVSYFCCRNKCLELLSGCGDGVVSAREFQSDKISCLLPVVLLSCLQTKHRFLETGVSVAFLIAKKLVLGGFFEKEGTDSMYAVGQEGRKRNWDSFNSV